jgi:hypothetical protein
MTILLLMAVIALLTAILFRSGRPRKKLFDRPCPHCRSARFTARQRCTARGLDSYGDVADTDRPPGDRLGGAHSFSP